MKQNDFDVSYDSFSDVLYIAIQSNAPARSEEGRPGVMWRYDMVSGELVGVTVVDYDSYWKSRRKELVNQIASKFSLTQRAAKSILTKAH